MRTGLGDGTGASLQPHRPVCHSLPESSTGKIREESLYECMNEIKPTIPLKRI